MPPGGSPIIVPLIGDLKPLKRSLKSGKTLLLGFGAAATAAFAGVAASSVSEFAKLDKGVREVATLVGDATDAQIKALQQDIRSVATEYGQAGTDVAKAFYDSLSAGVADPSNVRDFAGVAAKFAAAGATDIGAGVDLLSSALNAFKIETSDAARVSDVFFGTVKAGKTTVQEIAASFSDIGPTAAAAGVSIEDVSAWLAQLTLSGTPTAQATTQIKAALAELSKEGTTLSSHFQAIAGKSFRAFIAEGGNLEGAMALISQRSEDTGKSMFEMSSSIRSVQGLLGITGENADRFSQTLGLVTDSAGATDTAFGVMSESLDMQLRRFKAAASDIQYSIGEALLPAVLPLLERLATAMPIVVDSIGDRVRSVVSHMRQIVSTSRSVIQSILQTTQGAMYVVWTKVLGGLKDLLGAFLEVYKTAKDAVEDVAKDLAVVLSLDDVDLTTLEGVNKELTSLKAVVTPLWTELTTFGSTIQQVVLPALSALGVVLGALGIAKIVVGVKAAVAGIQALVVAVKSGGAAIAVFLAAVSPVTWIVVALAALVAGLTFAYLRWEGFREIVHEVAAVIWDSLKAAFEWVQGFFEDHFIPLPELAAMAWDALRKGVVLAGEGMVWAFDHVIRPAVGALVEALRAFWDFVGNMWDGVVGFFRGGSGETNKYMQDIIDLWTDHLKPALQAFGDFVAQVLWPIIKETFGLIVEVVRAATEALVTAFKVAFGLIVDAIKAFAEFAEPYFRIFLDTLSGLFGVFFDGLKAIFDFGWTLIIEALSLVFDTIKTMFEVATALFTGDWGAAWDSIREYVSSALGTITTILTEGFALLAKLFSLGLNALTVLWDGTWDVLVQAFRDVWDAVAMIWDGTGKPVIDAISSAVRAVISAIERAQTVISKFNPANVIKDIGGGLLNVLPFAEGGIVTRPTLGLVGEAGPEAVIPLDQLGQAGNTYHVTVNIDGGLDSASAIGERVEEALTVWSAHKGELSFLGT